MEHEKLHVLVNFEKLQRRLKKKIPLISVVFQTLQTRKNDLSKTFRLTSLQKPKLQPVQSPVSLSGYFHVSLNLMACSQCLNMTQLL